MHELSVCQAMMAQVEEIAAREGASAVSAIVVRIGPLSGVVPDLLQQAFTIARAGTLATAAELITELQPIRIRCLECDAESEVQPNRLLCGACGSYRTQVISGDELLLASVELDIADSPANAPV
ncbi:MAG: hydrogenase maturation nickel metallochaperone HypA [Chromatiales bacterium]|jgi:hydrogenase nickel incorporation protein HypA/HybF